MGEIGLRRTTPWKYTENMKMFRMRGNSQHTVSAVEEPRKNQESGRLEHQQRSPHGGTHGSYK